MDKNEIELMALATEVHAIVANIEGMKALNQERKVHGSSAAYDETSFLAHAEDLKEIARLMRELRGEK